MVRQRQHSACVLASGQTQKRLAACSSFHGRVEAPSEVPQLVPGFSDFPCGARSAVCSVSLGVHMRSPFCRGARPSLSRGECGPGRPPPRVRFQTWALGFPRIVIREPRCLGEQHFSCTGASMGSCGGSFVGRWHRESGTSPTWPQMGPAPVPTPSQVPVGLARAPQGRLGQAVLIPAMADTASLFTCAGSGKTSGTGAPGPSPTLPFLMAQGRPHTSLGVRVCNAGGLNQMLDDPLSH